MKSKRNKLPSTTLIIPKLYLFHAGDHHQKMGDLFYRKNQIKLDLNHKMILTKYIMVHQGVLGCFVSRYHPNCQ